MHKLLKELRELFDVYLPILKKWFGIHSPSKEWMNIYK